MGKFINGGVMKERRYITRQEMKLLLHATREGRHYLRDRCMIIFGYMHGLRVSELAGLKVTDIDLLSGCIYIRRLKGGFSTTHMLTETERKALSEWLKIRPGYIKGNVPWLFLTSGGNKMSRQQFYKLLRRYSEKSGLPINIHPHMLRHGCGYDLANQGLDTRLIQDYLGHKNIRHTVHYTAGNAARFSVVWQTAPPPGNIFGEYSTEGYMDAIPTA